MSRRQLMRSGALGAGALALGPAFWRDALASPAARPGGGPYGPLGAPDANGLRLPRGFRSRVIARGLVPVAGTAYTWHIFSDGQATYRTEDGGFVLVSNCEAPPAAGGGASAIRFDSSGQIRSAYRILGGTDTNCAGGRTPWNTWLSCEEVERGRVWECDPFGVKPAVVRPAMGVFNHEAAAVDPDDKRVYLTEDEGDGGFYRFTPDRYPDLSRGLLEVAVVARNGDVSWRRVPDPSAATTPTRKQIPGMTRFRRGEGIWFDAGVVYVVTTSDSKVHAYETVTETIEVLYDKTSGGALKDADNLTVSPSGDIFVCEDADNLEMSVISREREVAPFVQLAGTGDGPERAHGRDLRPVGLAAVLLLPASLRDRCDLRGHGAVPHPPAARSLPAADEGRRAGHDQPLRPARPRRAREGAGGPVRAARARRSQRPHGPAQAPARARRDLLAESPPAYLCPA